MITRSRRLAIRSLAREKLVEHGSMSLPVRPKLFAEQKLGIVVQPFHPPEPSVSGFLMRVGNSFGIGYSTAIRCLGFQNFTVAHEIGHFCIDDHALALLADGKHFSYSGYISKDRFEVEADAFATEFLMPWKLIESVVHGSEAGLAAVKDLADQCESSLVASAIRYTEITEEKVAVIVSHRGIVEFMTASTPFRQIPGIEWLRRGDPLPGDTASSRFASARDWVGTGSTVEDGSRLHDWFSAAPRRDVREDVVGLGSYGRLLTVLSAEFDDKESEEEEDEPEDDYIARWEEGRFRRK